MLLLTAVTYWLFYFVALGATAHLLFKTSYQHAVIIVGFYLLSRGAKMLGEYIFFKDKMKYVNALKQQGNVVTNFNQGDDNVNTK